MHHSTDHPMRRRCRALTAAALLGALLVTLAACGSSAPDTASPSGAREPAREDGAPPDASQPAEPVEPPGSGEALGTAEAPEPVSASEARSAAEDLRAAWIHLFDDTLKTREGIAEAVRTAADADLNALFVQVARRHDAYYASERLPRTPDPALEPGLDVLATAIEEARPHGIEVHAWLTFAPVYHHEYAELTLPPDHVYVRHGPDSADTWMTVDREGAVHDTYLDLALPAVQDHLAGLVEEIVSEYDVDGMHTDYVRYDGIRYGYHPRVLERFRSETGRTGTPEPGDTEWVGWRRAQIDALATRVAGVARAADPDVLVSAAVIAQRGGPASSGGFEGTVAFAEKLQNWPRWLETGAVDLAIPMVYFREADPQQRAWFREWTSYASELRERHPERSVAVGIGGWLNTVADGTTQASEALQRADGVAVFSFQQDSSDAPRGSLLRALPPPAG